MTTGRSEWRIGAIAYWAIAAFLTVFGYLAFLSIGAPFLVLGIALIVMWPFRRRPRLFWPVTAGVLALSAVFLLFAPLQCSRTATSTAEGEVENERADCSSVIGIDYKGTGDYEPSMIPALLAGLGVGAVAAVGTRFVVARRSESRS